MSINGFSSGNNAILFKKVANKPFVSKHRSLRANTTIVSANRVQTSSSTLSTNEKLTQASALSASNGNIGDIIEENLAENVDLNSSALVQRDSQGPMDYENENGFLSSSEIPASSSNVSIADFEIENSFDGTTANSNEAINGDFLENTEPSSSNFVQCTEKPNSDKDVVVVENDLTENVQPNISALAQISIDYENGSGLLSPSEILTPAFISNDSIVDAEPKNSSDYATANLNEKINHDSFANAQPKSSYFAENIQSSALVQRGSQGPMDYENGNVLLSLSEIPASSSNGSIADAVDNVSNFLLVQAELENSFDGTTADLNDILLPFLPQVEQSSNAEFNLFESPPISIIDQNVPFFMDLPTPIQPEKPKRPVPLLIPICELMTVNRLDQVKQFPPRRPSIAARIVFDHASKETVSKETITDNESFSESEDSFGKLVYESSSDE